jgi:hypothetical protein
MSFKNSCRPSDVPSGLRSNEAFAGARLGGALDAHARRSGRIDLLDQLDLAALEQAMQLLDVGVLKAELGRDDRDLGVCEHADLQPARDQNPDLFKLLKIGY